MLPNSGVASESFNERNGSFAVIDSATEPEPFVYQVAAKLSCVLSLTREEQLATWRRVLDLYADLNLQLHRFLRKLQHEAFVEEILENEVFWGIVGHEVTREYYGRACQYLPALFAAAALLAAHQDGLPLTAGDVSLIH